ncbi:benomyl methotrexate resistance [Trichoderma arundinaceum]|uniref:Benomyl methotrexate resistance n=1 Tax=Trichoderma arundinaceum TaxID=490622 RepID=A0A395NG14_TRIAR|nr:benomyl methotrexate resistance [Trichoderma arundinaceum]
MFIQRLLSRAENKPYRTEHLQKGSDVLYLNEGGLLDFKPNDIENPRNWSAIRRFFITLCSIVLVVNATFASSAPSGCLESIAEEFGVSLVVAGLTVTLFLLGCCAGPLIFAPLSELYGRRWNFFLSFTFYVALTFICAFAPNFGALLAGRFLTGTFVSGTLSNAPGVITDLWDPIQRGNAMTLYSAVVWIGPALGPVVAGFLQLKKNWRWTFYVLLWLGGVSWALMISIPETHTPTILLDKARRIREIPEYKKVRTQVELEDRSVKTMFKIALTRPWIILFDPISFLCAVYMAVVYALLFMLFSIYPIVFQEKRGWNSGVGELPLLGTIIGATVGAGIAFIDASRRDKKIQKGTLRLENIDPEDRLPLAMVGGVGFSITMFWFAWSSEYNSVHWIVPTLAGVFLSMSMLLIFVGYINYLVDTYVTYAASAIAANTIARCASGASAPLFTNQMFKALGVGGGGSLIGGVAAALAIIPFLFYRYSNAEQICD